MKKKKEVALGIIGLSSLALVFAFLPKFKREAEAVSTEPQRETEEERMLALCGQPCPTEYCM